MLERLKKWKSGKMKQVEKYDKVEQVEGKS